MSQEFVDNVFDSTFEVQTTMANVEKNFAALKSSFSGAGAPSDPIAGMWWFDTTSNILKLRNEANNAWQSVWDFANNKPLVTNNVSADFGAALKDPAVGTAGLRTLGNGAQQAAPGNNPVPSDGSITPAKLADAVAGDTCLVYNDGTEYTTDSNVYVSVAQVVAPRGGAFRIKFDLHGSGISYGYAKIYRNGSPVGTQRASGYNNAVYATWSEDISGWSSGDLVQIYAYKYSVYGSGYPAFVKNIQIYTTNSFQFTKG